MTSPLMAELTLHEYVGAQLVAQFPDADEETLADTLEGLTDLREMLARVIRSFLDDRTISEGLSCVSTSPHSCQSPITTARSAGMNVLVFTIGLRPSAIHHCLR